MATLGAGLKDNWYRSLAVGQAIARNDQCDASMCRLAQCGCRCIQPRQLVPAKASRSHGNATALLVSSVPVLAATGRGTPEAANVNGYPAYAVVGDCALLDVTNTGGVRMRLERTSPAGERFAFRRTGSSSWTCSTTRGAERLRMR